MIVNARRHLYLAGFMGTGKSAAGPLIAESLCCPFYDQDAVTARLARLSVLEIFSIEGESAFRNYESRALRSLVGGSASVIALGGGAPTTPSLRALVAESGRTVLLTSDIAAMWERLQGDNSRPLLAGQDGGGPATLAEFTARAQPILAARNDVYREIADWTLDTSRMTPHEVANRVLEWWHA